MSVFPFPDISPSESTVSLVSNTAINQSPHTGKIQTVDRQGERLRMSMTFRNLKDDERGRLQAFIARLNGQQHRFTVYDHSYTARGVLSAVEMLDVAFNATNWISSGTPNDTLTDIDYGIRVTKTAGTASLIRPTTSADGISAPVSALSYAGSLSTMDSRLASDGGSKVAIRVGFREASSTNEYSIASVSSVNGQRHIASATAPSASTLFIRPVISTAGYRASIDVSNLSCARALLVDNGFNAILRSEEFDNASWVKSNSTVSADSVAAPDLSTTADELVEDSTSSTTHHIQQRYTRASVSEYWTASVWVKENTSQRIRLQVQGGSGNGGFATFDANAGSISAAALDGGTGTNTYASIHDSGNGWYRCRVSSRLPATTSALIRVYLCDGASNTATFDGDGTSGLYIWGAQLQRGGQLGRYTPTTTTATTGTSQTGKQVWVKGLDADTNGQRKVGDQVEIDGHLAILTSDLDGDESGVGLLEFTPRIPTAPADEAPVVLYRPHGKWILTNTEQGWSNRPGVFSDFTIEAVQDI